PILLPSMWRSQGWRSASGTAIGSTGGTSVDGCRASRRGSQLAQSKHHGAGNDTHSPSWQCVSCPCWRQGGKPCSAARGRFLGTRRLYHHHPSVSCVRRG